MTPFSLRSLVNLFFPPHTVWPWWMALLTVLVWLWYQRGVRRLDSHVHPVSMANRFWTRAGIVIGFLAVIPPIDSVADSLYVVHMLQHFLLEMVAPFCLALGAPLAPLIAGLPGTLRHRVFTPLARNRVLQRIYRMWIHPVGAALLFAAVCGFWLLPGPFTATVLSGTIDSTCHATLLIVGLFFWWMVLDPRTHRSRDYLIHFVVLMVLMNFFIVIAAYITLTSHNLYPVYDLTSRALGIPERVDQELGGLLLWIPGSLIHVLGALVVFHRWIHEDQKRSQATGRLASLSLSGGAIR